MIKITKISEDLINPMHLSVEAIAIRTFSNL